MGSASTDGWRKYVSSMELNYITYLHRAIYTGNTLLFNWVLLLKQISLGKKKEQRSEWQKNQPDLFSCLQSTRTAPHSQAKTGDAEGNQHFSSLRLKVKLNQPSSGSKGTCFQSIPKGRDAQRQPQTFNMPPLYQQWLCPNLSTNTSILCMFPKAGFPSARPLQTRGRLPRWVSPSASTEAANAWAVQDSRHTGVCTWWLSIHFSYQTV